MKPASAISLLGTAFIVGSALADWQFKSRPDLAPPRLNITIPAADDVEKGYLFIAPFAGLPDQAGEQHGPRQAAPYIFRDDGDLIWSGYGYYSIWATNFQAGRFNGKDILFSFEGDHNAGYGHGHGHTTIIDKHYDLVTELRAGNHKLTDKHEFHIINEKTALIQIYQPTPADLTEWGASPEQQWIVDAIFQELDIETGALLFEWSSLEHVSPSEAVLPINPGQAGSGYNSSDAWDYFHVNSVDKDDEGNYLISARDACSVHKINGTTGEIIWKLHGKDSSFTFKDNVKFCFQHHARFVSRDGDEEVISLYDNSAHGTENDRGSEVHTAPTSSGKIIRVNTKTWKAELIQAFFPPDDLRSKSQGSTQLLPNGNVIVNWGSEGALTEFRADGTPIFHTYMDSDFLGVGVENYRGFRYNWTGLPREVPAIIALEGNDGAVTAYVSWNGDTETDIWRFYTASDEYSSRKHIGDAKRASFETALRLGKNVKVTKVLAEAIDSRGQLLVTTSAVAVRAEILPAHSSSKFGNGQALVDQAGDHASLSIGSNWEDHMILKYTRAGASSDS